MAFGNKLPVLLALLLLAASVAADEPAREARDKVRGFDLESLALATAKATAFSTEYGTGEGSANFEIWLRGRGLSLADYDVAYETFLARFAADPSGRLEESYFAALDRYTPGERRPELKGQTAGELDGASERGQVDAAYRADAWAAVDAAAPAGQPESGDQRGRINQMLADSQALASSGYLALQEAGARQHAAQFDKLRKGSLPAGEAEAPEPAPAAPVVPPAEPSSIAALHQALLSPLAESRRGAARAFAWECDQLALMPPAERSRDQRAETCSEVELRAVWLPVALEIFDAAPQAELHRVAALLDYLRAFDLEADARPRLEALRQRLVPAELEATARLAEARSAPEGILQRKRSAELGAALDAVERALGH